MPGVSRNPALPTLYLDTSHLRLAYEASLLNTRAADWRPLHSLLFSERINLCLSFLHLLEFLVQASHGNPGDTLARAEWLESLPVVWIRSTSSNVEHEERKHALLIAAGAKPTFFDPFFASFIQMMASGATDVVQVSRMLDTPTILAFYHECKDGSLSVEKLRALSLASVQSLVIDRRTAEDAGVRPRELAGFLEAKQSAALISQLRETHNELIANGTYKHSGLKQPTNAESDSVFSTIAADRSQLIAQRLIIEVTNNLARRLLIENPNINGANFKRHASTLPDMLHCVGAAFCDVFTCDQRTAADLGEVRSRRGLQPALHHAGNTPSAFIDNLENQIATARR
jgi:hypothetical protein